MDVFKKPIDVENVASLGTDIGSSSDEIGAGVSINIPCSRVLTSSHIFSSDDDISSSIQLDSTNNKTRSDTKPVVFNPKSNQGSLPEVNIPSWCGLASQKYGLEVLKDGRIIETLDLVDRASVVFGRVAGNDVQLDHPSISRRHCVLAFRVKTQNANHAGWYLKDLGSTHGCFVNKIPLKPFQWRRVMVGHVIKFGLSTRLYIMQGPEDDMESESELSVTEIKEKAQKLKDDLEEKETKSGGEDGDKASSSSSDDEGSDQELGESVRFMSTQQREQYYINDPEKALKCFFDREGLEMEFQFLEKGSSCTHQWCCQAELPIESKDGNPILAEATISGSKHEAQVQCALEACRILDAHGVLRRNSNLRKRRRHNWEENDFYNSDEDEFLDRTGDLARKREKRRQLVALEKAGNAARSAGSVGETYDGLLTKLDITLADIASVNSELASLARIQENTAKTEFNEEDLDDYMSKLKSSNIGGSSLDCKVKKSKLKAKLAELQKEELRLRRLAEIAKPSAKLPDIADNDVCPVFVSKPLFTKSSYITGSIKRKGKFSIPKVNILPSQKNLCAPKPLPAVDSMSSLFGEEITKSDCVNDETLNAGLSEQSTNCPYSGELKDQDSDDHPISSKQNDAVDRVEDCSESKAVVANAINSDALTINSCQEVPSVHLAAPSTKRKRTRVKTDKSSIDETYSSLGSDYATWMPPQGQTGDGRTSLNEKFGY